MYSKEEASLIRKKFWTSFGHYMKMYNVANGRNVNWLNYKTGIKYLDFKTDVTAKSAQIIIEFSHSDTEIRALMFEQFYEFELLFKAQVGADWEWVDFITNEVGKEVGKIELRLLNVSLFKEESWLEIMQFLKENLIKLDEFWEQVKENFQFFR